MSRIQSSVGLITGIPIADTVEQLLEISARPRNLLVDRNEQLQSERVAVTELTALVIGVQFSIDNLGTKSLFERKQVSSSNEDLLNVTTTGSPAAGTFEFTPVRQAQNHQLLSSGFRTQDEPLGEGEISLRFGGFVDKGVSLDELNNGDGVQRGRLRITDRSGASAHIDLRFAQTIDDVIKAINENNDVDVTASAVGDRLQLLDTTGQSVSNLRVQEVGSGRTAADLGLDAINTADNLAVGQDIFSLHEDLQLSQLNDGTGVFLRAGVPDLEVTFSDGSTPLQIEFLAETKGQTISSATTEAVNGVDAQFTLTSEGTGEEWDGYDVVFENDDEVTSGNEKVEVDTITKQIRFKIDAGATRAVHLVNALNGDEEASQYFVAALDPNGDGTGVVNLDDIATTSGGAIEYADESTLGEILATINAADPTRLRAEINSSGDGIDLIDLTANSAGASAPGGPNLWNLGQPISSGPDGQGTSASGPNLWNLGQPIPNATTGSQFSVRSLFGGRVAEDLGLTADPTDGTIRGQRALSGLSTVLLDSLSGGHGLGELGALSLTDRSGTTATVDFSDAETLEHVISAINEAQTGIFARVNSARNGIELVDTTSGEGNLVVASADSTGSAEKLQIAADTAASSVNSGSLNLQTFHENLELDELKNGRGVGAGSFLITDSSGGVSAVNIRVAGIKTVGELIDHINGLSSVDVEARINRTGDGLLLLDRGSGEGSLSVRNVGSGTAATDLGIEGSGISQEVDGTPGSAIDGSTTLRVRLDSDDTLADLVTKINEADGDVAASVFSSGSGSKPLRLSIVSQLTGTAGELLIDASSLDIRFDEVVEAKDSLLMLGSADAPIAAALASSSSNDFESLIDGVTVSIAGTSEESVTINIEQTDKPVLSQIELFVEQYNKLKEKLDELTFFDAEENTTGVLFGRSEVLRVEFDLTNLITGRYFGAGPIQSLEEVGLSLDGTGTLRFDEEKFRGKYEDDPEAVERFFTEEELGVSAKFVKAAEQLAGVENSVLINRTLALQQTMELNDERIATLSTRLDEERESLLEEFFRLETAIGRLQNSLTAVGQIQAIPPLVSLGGAQR